MKLKYEPEQFQNQNMPKPTEIIFTSLSWEDVYGRFLESEIDPTRIQIIKAFEYCLENGIDKYVEDNGMNGYWQIIDEAVDQFSIWTKEDDEEFAKEYPLVKKRRAKK